MNTWNVQHSKNSVDGRQVSSDQSIHLIYMCANYTCMYAMHAMHAVCATYAMYSMHAVCAMYAVYAVHAMCAMYAMYAMCDIYAMCGMYAMKEEILTSDVINSPEFFV